MTVYRLSIPPELMNLALHKSPGFWWGPTVVWIPTLLIRLKKIIIKSHKQYKNITYLFIAYWTQRSILFCCTETNKFLRAVSSSEDAVFSMRTFTWSWWLPVLLCRSDIGSNIELYGLHFGTRLTTTYLGSRHPRAAERHTHTKVFWTFFPLVPPHFGDWHCHLHRCYRSESSSRRIW